MGCFFGDGYDEARKKSKQIDNEIKRGKVMYRSTHRLLLLGTRESGKSTIMKQMKILHVDGFNEREKLERIEGIKRNIRDAILSITGAMKTLVPPIRLQNEEHQWRIDWLHENMNDDEDGHVVYSEEFFDHVITLWSDQGVRNSFDRCNEYQLIDCAQYFLDRADIVRMRNYSPTNQDVLRCRHVTRCINEKRFVVGKVLFHIFDIGGQRDDSRKWMQCFNDTTAIIFVVSCSSYDMLSAHAHSREDNKLKESVELFTSMWNNKHLAHISVILFLNKQDLLKQKVLANKSNMVDYFPSFAQYRIPDDAVCEEGEVEEVVRTRYFIRDEFLKVSVTNIIVMTNQKSVFGSRVMNKPIRRVYLGHVS